jgi:glutaredoxin
MKHVMRSLPFVVAAALASTTVVASASGLAEFGRCLGRQGATFYGASWCPHCRRQREALGEAMSGVRYVECAVDGGREATASACTAAKVNSFPTWVFADGSRAAGAQSLAALAAKTGCALPSEGGHKSHAGTPGETARPPGPKVIEVPH